MSRNPYPGLRPFRPDEAHLFFGRESQVDAMVDRLAAARFLAVVGSSGCGKSSLVTCGLRPALQRGLMSGAGSSWRIATFRPGADPVGALAQALAAPGLLFDAPPEAAAGAAAQVSVSRQALVESTLRLSKRGLVDLVEQARLPATMNLLLVIDQFEELFRYRTLAAADPQATATANAQAQADGRTAQDSVALVNLLLEAVAAPGARVYGVLTMRSDFLGDCTQFMGLAEAINAGQYLVPRLSRDERRAAITGPAAVAGAAISPTLVTRLVNDVGDNPDQLSILQHALNRTWAAWSSATPDLPTTPLTLAHYEAIGTMAHALDRHAERSLAELADDAARLLAERVFKALTDRAADPRGVRRPTRLDMLCKITGATPETLAPVLAVFRKPSRSFLMPPAQEPLAAETVIDISHESLMRVWERLKRWTDDEAQSAQRYKRVAETAALHGTGAAGLWRDPDLQLALDWRAKAAVNAAWAACYAPGFEVAMAFLDLSRADRDAELARDAQQARQAQRDQTARTRAEAQVEVQMGYARRMRRGAYVGWTLALFAVALAGLSATLWRDAEHRRSDGELAQQAALASKERDEAERIRAIQESRDTAERFRRLQYAASPDPRRQAMQRQVDEARQLTPQPAGADLPPDRLSLGKNAGSDTANGQTDPALPPAGLPTLYIQYQGDEQKPLAERLRAQATEQRMKAPEVERVRAGPRTPELRIFHEQDRPTAQAAVAWMKDIPGLAGLSLKLVTSTGNDAGQSLKPGKLELWFGPPGRRLLVVAGLYLQRDHAEAQALGLTAQGLSPRVIETRNYPNLREGFYATVFGPFSSDAEAKKQLDALADKVKDAYIRSGW